MQSERKEGTENVSAVSAVDETNQGDRALFEFVKSFTRPVRSRPNHLLLDCFDTWFCLLFDFDPCPEYPESIGKCDIEFVPLPTNDVIADGFVVVSNADKFGVMRMLAAIGVDRFDDKVKTAFYQTTNPLR